jgi:hypothetical protein
MNSPPFIAPLHIASTSAACFSFGFIADRRIVSMEFMAGVSFK